MKRKELALGLGVLLLLCLVVTILPARAEPEERLGLTTDRATAVALPGESFTVNYTVNATGTKDASITMYASNVPERWKVVFDNETFTLEANTTKTVKATITLPLTGSTVAKDYAANIKITAQDSARALSATQTITVTVGQLIILRCAIVNPNEVVSVEALRTPLSAREVNNSAGGTVMFTVRVYNFGNTGVTAEVQNPASLMPSNWNPLSGGTAHGYYGALRVDSSSAVAHEAMQGKEGYDTTSIISFTVSTGTNIGFGSGAFGYRDFFVYSRSPLEAPLGSIGLSSLSLSHGGNLITYLKGLNYSDATGTTVLNLSHNVSGAWNSFTLEFVEDIGNGWGKVGNNYSIVGSSLSCTLIHSNDIGWFKMKTTNPNNVAMTAKVMSTSFTVLPIALQTYDAKNGAVIDSINVPANGQATFWLKAAVGNLPTQQVTDASGCVAVRPELVNLAVVKAFASTGNETVLLPPPPELVIPTFYVYIVMIAIVVIIVALIAYAVARRRRYI